MDIQIIWIALAIGLGAGIMSGLIGIGGGIIMVPALVIFLQYTQHQAQGTSLAVLTLPVVILASYYTQCKAQGNPIDLRVVGLLAVGFILGAYLGGRWALSLSQTQLKQIFAGVLIYTAIRMLAWDQWLLQWIKKS